MLYFLDTFLKHCEKTILAYTNFDLAKCLARKEIVEGIIKAIKIVDKVIALIRTSTSKQDAKDRLISTMGFTEPQSEAIVNLRLYRLSNTNVEELEDELKQLNANIDEYTKIINEKEYRNTYTKKLFREYKKTFKDYPRKSSFSEEEASIQIEHEEIIEDKEVHLAITQDGYLKNVPIKSFEATVHDEAGMKEGDIIVNEFTCSQKQKAIVVTNKGNYVCLPIHKIESTK